MSAKGAKKKPATAVKPRTRRPAAVKEERKTAAKLIPIYIMGKRYEVPDGLTIMKAMEYAGYILIRGCGCRGGY